LLCGVAVDPVIHGMLGDPWVRAHLLRDARLLNTEGAEAFFPGVSVRWLVEPALRVFTEQELGLFPWCIAPIALLRVWRPTRGPVTVLALFVTVVSLWIFFGTISPMHYTPLVRTPRYLAPVVLPAVLLLAAEIVQRRRRVTRAAIVAVLVGSSIVCVYVDGGRMRLQPYRQARTVLADAGASVVLVEPGLSLPLLFVDGFTPAYTVRTLEAGAVPPSGTVLVVGSEAEVRRVEALAGVEVVTRIAKPKAVYQRLLRNPLVMAMLRLTRPIERVQDLEGKTAGGPALVVYWVR
jgi:hypothetical protein